MSSTIKLAISAAVLTLPLASCGGDAAPPADAGVAPASPAAVRPSATGEKPSAGQSPCALFTVAEISARLGAKVKKGYPSTIQQTSSCSWLAVVGGEGAVSIVRGPAAAYAAYKPDFTGVGKPRRQELAGVGDKAHVEGANQGGWGRWVAVAARGDVLTVVDITGVKVSQAAVTQLLKDALARS